MMNPTLGMDRTYTRGTIAAQVAKMRSDIRRCGVTRVGCEDLAVLCSDNPGGEQTIGVAQIAEWERWTFEHCTDGSVIFAPL